MRKRFISISKIFVPTIFGFYYGKKILLAQHQPSNEKPQIDMPELKLQNAISSLHNQSDKQKDQIQDNQEKQNKESKENLQEQIKQNEDDNSEKQKQIKEQEKDSGKQEKKGQQKQSKINLENNSIIVPENFSEQIVKYLEKCGYKIHMTSKQEKLRIKNRIGDERIFQSFKTDDQFFKFTNFMNPPYFLRSQNKQQLKEIFDYIKTDEHIIVTYLPDNYKIQPKNKFDTFTQKKQKDIQQLQNDFIENKYNSGSCKNIYLIVKDKEIANIFKIGQNRVGQVFIYSKPSEKNSRQATTMIEGNRFYVQNPKVYDNRTIEIDYSTHFTINQVNIDADMNNFLRKMRLSQDKRKVLLVFSKQNRPQFLKNINDILFRVGKLMEKQIIVITTKNQKLLKKYFQIIPDSFVTVRMLDIHTDQEPICVSKNKSQSPFQFPSFYSRRVMSGPFTVQNICQFIRMPPKRQYYEKNKNLSQIETIVDTEIESLEDTVLLYEKYGCSGCKYTKQILQNILEIMNNLDDSKIFAYQILDPELFPVSIKKINILNESQQVINTSQNDVTPRLEYHDKDYVGVIKIHQILAKLNSLGKKREQEMHKQIIRDIIEQVLKVKKKRKNYLDDII